MELVIKEAIDSFYFKEFERLTGYVREKDERIWQLIQQNREQDIELTLLRKVADAARDVKSAFEAAENYFDKESLYHDHLHDNYCRAETLLFETLEDLEGAIE